MVVYNYNEIPEELLVDHSYTLREIRLFLSINKDSIFLHKDINALDGESKHRVTVVSKDEYYIHQHVDRSYLIPYAKKVIYYLKG
ncbi:hypothetical protein O9H85_20280 [Paenibacillus filicis]|uniref:HTH LytTR-type domain-containing protein n=1 Tax=Paenibacillus gyeongsangnamensis TaxID=3388067 RepID=A0ABT4QCX7_9BACL|nr:hypothetical protein [Paenibacillus filicis]MCZ8514721.1 hypothetical protein [Paenibacillus filicis]